MGVKLISGAAGMDFTETAKQFGLATAIVTVVFGAAYAVLRNIVRLGYDRLFSDEVVTGPDGEKRYRGIVLQSYEEHVEHVSKLVKSFETQASGIATLVAEDKRQTELASVQTLLLERIVAFNDKADQPNNQYSTIATNKMIAQVAKLIYLDVSEGNREGADKIMARIAEIGAKYASKNPTDSDF